MTGHGHSIELELAPENLYAAERVTALTDSTLRSKLNSIRIRL